MFNHHSILFYVDRADPLGPEPTNPGADPQFNAWEEAIRAWAEKNNQLSSEELVDNSELIKPENKPTLVINSPIEGGVVNEKFLGVSVTASAPRGIKTIKYQLNETIMAGLGQETETTLSLEGLSNGYQKITVTACDDVGNCEKKIINFNLVTQ